MTAPTGGTARGAYDPFAPATPGFPERRLRRAGLDDEAVARLRSEYGGMDRAGQAELVRYVARNPDSRIAERFSTGRTRADLEAMTVERLLPLLRERRLPTDGRKAEMVDRLLASYGGTTAQAPAVAPQEAATAPPPPQDPTAAPEAASGDVGAPADAPAPATESPDAAPAPDTTTQEDGTNG